MPLAILPYGAAVIGWFAASVAALGGILLGPTKLGTSEGGRRWTSGSAVAAAAAVLVTFNVIQNNLLNGQVNFFVVLCCALAVKQTRAIAAGAWLGAAIALKLMPVLLVVYFLVRRRFLAILCAVATALVLMLAPGILITGSAADVHAEYARGLLMPMMTTPAGDAALTYSIAGMVQRVLGVGPALWIEVLCAAAVLATIAAVDVRTWRRDGDDRAAAAYLAAIILISPKSETHHLAFAIPAVALCCAWLFEEGKRRARLPAVAMLLSGVALVAAPFTGAMEGPMITAAMVLLIAAVMQLPTSCIRQRA